MFSCFAKIDNGLTAVINCLIYFRLMYFLWKLFEKPV